MDELKTLTKKFLDSGLVNHENYYSVEISYSKGQNLDAEFEFSVCGYPLGFEGIGSEMQTLGTGTTFDEALVDFKERIEKKVGKSAIL